MGDDFTRVDRTCNVCGREIFNGDEFFQSEKTTAKLLPGEKYFCPDCFKLLPKNNGYICAHCGRSTIAPIAFCDECTGYEWALDEARSPFYYAPPADVLVKKEKYSNRRYVAEIFEPFLSAYLVKYFSDADFITFVPMTKKARKNRGYNQSELLAKRVSEKTNYPLLDVIEKTIPTQRQAKLNRTERLNNLKSSFKVRNKALVEKQRIVIIDDVITTGATGETIASELKKAGAEKVYLLTVCSVTERRTAKLLKQSE